MVYSKLSINTLEQHLAYKINAIDSHKITQFKPLVKKIKHCLLKLVFS